MTAGTSGEDDRRTGLSRAAPGNVGARSRRPKFDKAASTTVLLTALLGLGTGATWQLVTAAPPAPGAQADETVPTGAVGTAMRVVVVDTSGLVLATFDAVIDTTDRPAAPAAVALSPGRAKTPVARTRAS